MKLGSNSPAPLPLLPPAAALPQVRQLEALVRLSEALARLHLSEHVTRDHVKEVSALFGLAGPRGGRTPGGFCLPSLGGRGWTRIAWEWLPMVGGTALLCMQVGPCITSLIPRLLPV